MKRTSALLASLLLASCSTIPTSTPAPVHPSGTYSNLGDDASLAEVSRVLVEAGLPQADVDAFAEQVRSFTAAVPTGSLATSFVPLDQAKADDGSISEAVSNQERLTNCRITTFTLAHSLITAGSPQGADSSLLFMDHEQIAVAPELFESSLPIFDVLNGRIPTTSDLAVEPRSADISAYLSDHEISFAEADASVMSVYIHDTLDDPAASFIGHTGVLADAGDQLLFVEKLAFDAPYRAIWFSNRAELRDYLMSMYDDGPGLDYGSPIIFENGHELKS